MWCSMNGWFMGYTHGQTDRQTDTLITILGCTTRNAVIIGVEKKVKFSPTRYRALGPELIPVYIQAVSPQVALSHPPGGRLPLLST